MELERIAQELINHGCRYGKTSSDRWWVFWREKKTYIIQCRQCSTWLECGKNSALCSACHKKKYNRTQYHQKRRKRLLRGAQFNCVACGESFQSVRKSKKTCSDKCRKYLSRHPELQSRSALPEWTTKDESDLKYYWEIYFRNTQDITSSEIRGYISKDKANELWDQAWEKFGSKAQSLEDKKSYLESIS